jgi:hypothetical protein
MLVYKCDGESYSTGNRCKNEVENELSTWWLSITGKIINGLHDAHYLECNGEKHFCSRRCLENFLFKDVNQPTGGALNMNIDPNVKTEETQAAPAEQTTETQEAVENKEEGTTGG